MLISCKVSNSVLSFLERNFSDLTFLYEAFDFPDEFLRDPSYWMPIDKMESFLFIAKHKYESERPNEIFVESVTAKLHELRTWGALDSVLRIMNDPIEIFSQPEKFLSYFISPVPDLEHIHRSVNTVSFSNPLNADDYPMVAAYLKSAFESLPRFGGKPMAQVEWNKDLVILEWSRPQSSLFEDDQKKVSPDLLQSIITTLQESQKALENKNKELVEKNQQLVLKNNTPSSIGAPKQLMPLNGNLQKMKDYFTRANQLVTILVGQDRMTRQVKEAMRRVDWEYTTQEFPRVVEESLHMLKEIPRSEQSFKGDCR